MANLEETINQAISDFDTIEQAIKEKGVDVPKGTDTSEYGNKVKEVYDEGYDAGFKSYTDRHMDMCEKNGGYANAFSGFGWADDTYTPTRPIKHSGSYNSMFSYCNITDTKVVIDTTLNSYNRANMFTYAYKLKTIRKIVITDTINCGTWFVGDALLENITFEGVIGRNINLQWATLLTAESAISIINCLKDFTGTDNEYSYTLTFADEVWARLDENTLPDGYTSWKDYVSDKGWLT